MAMSASPYGQAILAIGNGDLDLGAGTFKVMLATSTYTPNVDTDNFRDDVTSYEVASGSGYTTGGETITTPTWTYDSANNRGVFTTASTVTWTAASFTTAHYAVVYKSLGGAASADPLVSYVDFDADQSPGGANFIIDWTTNGIVRITLA